MIEWFFAPFEQGAWADIAIWYIGTMIVTFSIIHGARYITGETFDDNVFPDDLTGLYERLLFAAVIVPLIEESLFRILPIMVFGDSLLVVLACSILWAIVHGARAPIAAISVPLYVKLALSGMFVPMVALHMFHNGWVTTVHYIGSNR